MANERGRITGVEYNKTQVEYQYFPEAYFSGSDVTVYLGDLWVDDISGLEFTLQEQVLPIYGYNSYTWDAAPRGQRFVTGSFRVAFREAGYLRRILEHIGQLQHKAVPSLAYNLGGEQAPQWVASAQQTLEELLDQVTGTTLEPPIIIEEGLPPMKLGESGPHVGKLQKLIQEGYKGLQGPVPWNVKSGLSIATYGRDGFNAQKENDMRRLHKRINGYLVELGYWRGYFRQSMYEGAPYDLTTTDAVKAFQDFARLPVTGNVDSVTASKLNEPIRITNTYDAPTRLAIARFQVRNRLSPSVLGELDEATLQALGLNLSVVKKEDVAGNAARREYNTMEEEIWGRPFDETNHKYSVPYFYSTPHQEWLRSFGFDIWINYGPLPQAVIHDFENQIPDRVSFDTTIKAIRQIQLTGVSQILGPDGNPIEEVYSFIARDLD